MDPILEVRNLSLRLEKNEILKNISFTVKKGSFNVLAGRNGAGKSQLLRTLKGLQNPTSGQIFIKGEDVSRNKKQRLSKIALVFQDADVQSVGETVEKDIEFGPENLGLSREQVIERRESIIKLLSLEKLRDRRPYTLSGGEKRRVAIAGVLAMEGDIFLLDDPFSNLDYPSVLLVLETLVNLHKQGFTMIVVSHEIEKFLAHTDNVIILKQGTILYEGPSKESLPYLREAEVYIPSLPFEEITWLAL